MKVLIADGSALIRERLVEVINAAGVAEVIGQSNNGVEAITDVWRLDPDVVVLDIHLPHGNGIEVLKKIKKHQPSISVIMLAWSDDPLYREACLALGADAYINKASEFYKIGETLERLNNGHHRLAEAEKAKGKKDAQG